MGYFQFVSLQIWKDGADAETLRIAINLGFPDFFKKIGEWESTVEEEAEKINITLEGKTTLYEEGGVLFDGAVDLQKISEELGCTITVHYEGEHTADGEQIKFVKGEKVMHKVLDWVDAPP